MILILKRISPSVMPTDIESFITPALKGGLFSKSGTLEKISIKMLQAANADKPEFNALVRVEPDTVGQRIIKQLNRKALKGKPINVAKYYLRQQDNDRRSSRVNLPNDRRKKERRRLNLNVIDLTRQQKAADRTQQVKSWNTDITL